MSKRLTHIISLIILFIALFSDAASQDGIIKGRVQGKEKEILPAATVSIGKKTVVTNDAGEFLIPLKPGIYVLTISYTGYQPLKQDIKITSNETNELDFVLEISEELNDVAVLGSRSSVKRSSMNTAVPIDVISGQKLPRGVTDLTQQLFIIVPSFNSPPQSVGGSAFTNPATLRGLSPDETLVLVNGRRRLTTPSIFLQYSLGYGSVATDLNCIPAAAIENVQILRDGAAAQSGSDAIAGVLDIQLKKTTGQTAVNFHLGQLYKGDGDAISFDINNGFSLNKKGFLNLTFASRFSNPTQRNGWYDSTVYNNIPNGASQHVIDSIRALDDSTVLVRGFDRLNHRRIGLPQIFNSSLIVNGGYPLNKKTNLFWTVTVNYRSTMDRGSNAYRYPKDPTSVILALYPDGFQVKTFNTQPSASLIAGIEGETKKRWHWDISSTIGSNYSHSEVTNSNNASQFYMGKNAQTDFDPGTVYFTQNTNNINFTRNFANRLQHIKSFTVSYGGEFRVEHYRIKKGEEASYKNYSPGSNYQWGSQGVGGYSDSNAVSKYRYVSAAYLELETDINEEFLVNLAGRYEYYNDFAGNLAGKLAMRYKFSKHLLLRGSVSNGFRAPAMAQRYYSNTTNSPNRANNKIVATETFRNDSRTAEAFGISPLDAEKSWGVSGGITSSILKHINITLDAYWIEISDRITLTGSISKENSIPVKNILASLGKNDITSIRFFSNAISTHTKGIDLVVTGNWPIHKSVLEISLSGNYNKTTIYRVIQPAKNLPDDALHQYTLINYEERGRLEQGQPSSKIVFVTSYKTGKWEFGVRSVYFGKAAHIFSDTTRSRDEFFSPKILAGCSVGYSPKKWITIAAGLRNIFNTYPDKVRNKKNSQGGLVIYDFNGTQIGYGGGYYFVNMNFNF